MAFRPTQRAVVLLIIAVLFLIAMGVTASRGFTTDDPAPGPGALPTTAPPLGRVGVVPQSAAGRIVREAAGGRRPNVVVVMMDDMRADELRFTPNVRRHIVDRGLEFRNSFSPYPLCCPARSSFLKAQYAHNHGILYIHAPFAFGRIDDRVTIGSRLQDAGYRTALVGKYLNRYGVNRSRVTGRSSVRYVPAGWTDWMAALDPYWHEGELRGGSVYDYYDFTQNVNGQVTFNTGEYSSDVVARQAQQLVTKYHDENDDAPFFLWLNPAAPHVGGPVEPDDPPSTVRSDGTPIEFPTPARPESVQGLFDEAIPRALGQPAAGPAELDIEDKPDHVASVPEATLTEQLAMRDLERQRAESLYAWDVQFGKVIERLRRTGEYDDTILMFTSDNGWFNGEHRQRQGKVKAYEPSLRVPFAVAGPGIEQGVRFSPITTADVTATILDIARAQRLPAMDSASLLSAMTGPDEPWDVPVVTEGLLDDVPRTVPFPRVLTTSGLRTGRYKLIRYASGEAELYDLAEDPNELQNVYDDPVYRARRDRLDRLWGRYHSCRADECQVPLPRSLRMSPEALGRLDADAVRAKQELYG